ncbi:MAG: hypothetical protein [Caudovirales sp. ctOwN3]|nr:MAG: hypothetical protein [Caudovirales sp. ctOwN3]
MSKIFCIFYSYLIIAFISMEYNPINWIEFNRIMFIGIAFIWIMLLRLYENEST